MDPGKNNCCQNSSIGFSNANVLVVIMSPMDVIMKIKTLLPPSGHRKHYSVIRSASLLLMFLFCVILKLCFVFKSCTYTSLLSRKVNVLIFHTQKAGWTTKALLAALLFLHWSQQRR